MFSSRTRLLRFQCLFHDLLLTLLAFPLTYALRSRLPRVWPALNPLYPIETYWPLLAGAMVLFPVIGYGMGTYQRVPQRTKLQLAGDSITLVIVASVPAFAALYLFHAGYVSRTLVLLFAAVEAVLLTLGRWCFFSAGAWFRNRLERYRYCLIVGTGAAGRELAKYIEDGRSHGLRLVGFVETPAADAGDLNGNYRVFSLEAVSKLLDREPVDEVLFAVNHDELRHVEPLLLRCQEEGIHTRFHLDFLPMSVSHVYLETLQDVPLLTFAPTPNDELLLFLKRALDAVLAAVALIVLSPVLLAVALAVRVSSPGPILYRQTRYGVNGRRFTLFKFRSMVAGADKLREELEERNETEGPVFKMANDPRCTTVGRWLRRFSLDELPQLWNILRGDMSFVGPRPLPEELAKYQIWQRRRLRMRPGLTCLWVVEGRSKIKFDRWMQLDLAYIDNWSLWLDLKIFLKTIPLVLRGRGAC
ncbi:MAG: sugar transferase [Terriglobales bacterium]